MADENSHAATKSRKLQTDFMKAKDGARPRFVKLLPKLYSDMGQLIHRVESCYLDIDAMTQAKDMTVERCINILMASIAKINAKPTAKKNLENTFHQISEAEKNLAKNLSEVHTLYFYWKEERQFLQDNPFPDEISANIFTTTMDQWEELEQLYSVIGSFKSKWDILYGSLTDPQPRDSRDSSGTHMGTGPARYDKWKPPSLEFPKVSEGLSPSDINKLVDEIKVWFMLGGDNPPSNAMVYSILRS